MVEHIDNTDVNLRLFAVFTHPCATEVALCARVASRPTVAKVEHHEAR